LLGVTNCGVRETILSHGSSLRHTNDAVARADVATVGGRARYDLPHGDEVFFLLQHHPNADHVAKLAAGSRLHQSKIGAMRVEVFNVGVQEQVRDVVAPHCLHTLQVAIVTVLQRRYDLRLGGHRPGAG
jgi:hypothetical protein